MELLHAGLRVLTSGPRFWLGENDTTRPPYGLGYEARPGHSVSLGLWVSVCGSVVPVAVTESGLLTSEGRDWCPAAYRA